MFEASHLQHNIVSGYIQIVSDGHYLPAFWAHPDVGGPFPGLVLLHDLWGLTAHTRTQVRRFAEQGYYVVAPDLFNRQTATSPLQAQALIEQVGEAAQSHVTAALNALKTHNKCNNKVGLIGWGYGARLALFTAVFRDDLRAVVIFYGLPDNLRLAPLRMLTCPLLVILAEHDPDIPPETVNTLRATLAESALAHEVKVYPGVERDFFDDSRPTFEAVSAEDAWNHALAFFNTHLEVPKPPQPGTFDPGRIY